jgi:hypothetical protein
MVQKYYYDTSLGTYCCERTPAEIKAQVAYEYKLRAEATKTLVRLKAEGKRVSIHYSNSFSVANRGLTVMPVPRLTPEGQLAWTVR